MNPPELDAILKWNPPLLRIGATSRSSALREPQSGSGISSSKHTKPPASYDKHLPENFILKRVVTLNDLPERLAALVDQAIKPVAGKLPPWTEISTAARERAQAKIFAAPLVSEDSVIRIYDNTIGTMCPPIASTLTFTPGNDTWVDFVRVIPRADSDAKPDRVLKMIKSHLDDLSDEAKCYEEIRSVRYRELAKEAERRFRCLLTVEMKSATVGDANKMYRIGGLVQEREAWGRDFPWTSCPSPEECKNTAKSSSLSGHESQVDPPSPDPVNTLINLFGSHSLPPLPKPSIAPRKPCRKVIAATQPAEEEFLSQGTELDQEKVKQAEDRLDAQERDAKQGHEEPAAHVLQQVRLVKI